MIVADTNLVAYLLLPTGREAEAGAVHQRDPVWIAPPLWQSEFRNVLVLNVRHGVITQNEAREAWVLSTGLVHEEAPTASHVFDVAFERSLTAYDAEFVALAETLGVRVVTDDRRVLNACPDLATSITVFAAER